MKDKAALAEEVRRQLKHIAPDVEPDELGPDQDMRDELDLDSMDFLRLLEALSKSVGVAIPEADYAKVTTLAKMVDYLAAHQP
ncbi:phosphopantetheine-binding protein [Gallaecimonas kandeliae]|uniref:acyl carrier protein n=1 Tax=Gallaecimonas kandeliae TaxID=3029055 RepID=UPI00264854B2|nr:phosphopantetheine-binding protein [Gallaecimonas kandeliae]WKE64201.1 phosphopantetheine-binding protein [Gallaecimonas kandeliae]